MSSQGALCRLSFLLTVLLGAVAQAAPQEATLRWKFREGESTKFTLTHRANLETTIAGNKVHNNFTLTTFGTWHVTSVDQVGVAEVKQTIDRIKFQIRSSPPGKDLEVDTANEHDAFETPEGHSKLFRSLIGSEFVARVTTRGEFRDVRVPPLVVDVYKQLDPPGRVLGDKTSLTNMLSRACVVLPEGPIHEGSSWLVRQSVPVGMGTMIMESNHTVTHLTESAQTVEISGKGKIEPERGSLVDVVNIKSQEQSGRWRFDSKAGVMKSSAITQKFSLRLKFGDQTVPADFEWGLDAEFEHKSKPK